MTSARLLGTSMLLLLIALSSSQTIDALSISNDDNDEPTTTTVISTTTLTTIDNNNPNTNDTNTFVKLSPPPTKIARRIIDDRLNPPRATEFYSSAWNKRLPPLGEIHHRLHVATAPKVNEDDREGGEIDEGRDKAKKTRNVGPTAGARDPNCCGGDAEAKKSLDLNNSNDKDKNVNRENDELDVERGNGADGPAPRFHGNRPYDDRYGGNNGWKSSSYIGWGRDRNNYYDQRNSNNNYAYDRYGSSQRPSPPSSYAIDGDRYSSSQRPSSSSSSSNSAIAAPLNIGDRYNTKAGDRFGTNRPINNYQSAGGAYANNGPLSYNRPRPIGGGYGGNIDEQPNEGDYPFEGDSSPPGHNNIANLQTQKAIALKALAGVALIGAAAALASNPVLLPISVISGRRRKRRRRRSAAMGELDRSDDLALTALLQGYIQPESRRYEKVTNSSITNSTTTTTNNNEIHRELVISHECVARLACHVHRDYLDELDKRRPELVNINPTAYERSATNNNKDKNNNNKNNNDGINKNVAAADDDDDDDDVGDTTIGELEHWFDSLYVRVMGDESKELGTFHEGL